MLGRDGEGIQESQKQTWNFKFEQRSFRKVLLVEKNDIPVGYINLDDENDVALWKEVQDRYFK